MSQRPELRLITFDADQTLSDFHSVLKLALRETAAFLNEYLETPLSPQELQDRRMRFANDPAHKQTPMMELRRLAIADALAGHEDQLRLTNEALTLFRDIRFTKLRSMPFADDLIKQLYGKVRLGWITNGNSRPEHTGYDDLFDVTILAEDVGFQKPQAEIFEMALEAVGGVRAGQWLHVGDDLIADVGGAQKAGGRAVWFDHGTGQANGSIKPDHRIANLAELPAILEGYSLQL